MHLVLKCRKQIFEDRHAIIDTLVSYSQDFGVPTFSFAIGHDHVHFL
jgi:REP element-mobilizing transposase RayT